MGTFHDNKSELHGITVVVDTAGPKVYVGRCDDMDDRQVILLDADEHEDGKDGRSKEQYVQRAAKFGVWKKHERLVIPRAQVTKVQKLGEVYSGAPAAVVSPPKPAESPAPAPKPKAAPDANGAVVALTPNAQEEVRRLIAADGKPGLGLRLGVKGGGCSGFSYRLEFDQKKEGDTVIPSEGFSVFLDRKSLIYLRGITLDYQKGLQGKGFVFHNPNASNTCGCGESFSV